MMNLSIIVVIAGVFFLLMPQTMWIGLAFLALGTITYLVFQKKPVGMPVGRPRYLSAWPQIAPQQQAGVGWSIKRPLGGERNPVALARNPLEQPESGPKLENGVFSLPLPMNNEVAQFVNLKYKVPTKAKGFTEEAEKPSHPLIPGF